MTHDAFAWSDEDAPDDGSYGWGAEDLQPRWAPDVPLAERITRVGRFRRIDPSDEGSLWSAPRWWALAAYLGIVGWAFAKARRLVRTDDMGEE